MGKANRTAGLLCHIKVKLLNYIAVSYSIHSALIVLYLIPKSLPRQKKL